MNFSTKARLERMLNERLGFEPFKAAEVTNVLADRLTDEQKRYFYSGSRTVEQMEYFEKDIRFEDDNILTENFSFAKMKLRNEKVPHLTITDGAENFVVLSGLGIDRAKVEQDIRKFLHIKDDETIAALIKKAERLGFADKTLKKRFKQFTIERETLNSCTVTSGTTVLKLDLDDKEAAVKQLEETFGISPKKAERIVDKAAKQSVSANTLKRIKSILPKKENALEHKTRERGSRK
jgi:DNA-directed RNA polymerase subunit F